MFRAAVTKTLVVRDGYTDTWVKIQLERMVGPSTFSTIELTEEEARDVLKVVSEAVETAAALKEEPVQNPTFRETVTVPGKYRND